MSVLSLEKRDLLAAAALLMLSIAILGIGHLASKTVKQTHLMHEAETTALRWATLFEDRREDTYRMFRERRADNHLSSIIWSSREVGRVIAYELYDKSGQLFYTTGPSNWVPFAATTMLASPVTQSHNKAGAPTTRLHDSDAEGSPRQYASVVIPFHIANDFVGSVVAYVDQSDQAYALTNSFSAIATATAILLMLAFGAAGYVTISKSRESLNAEARARYLSEHDELTGLPNRRSFERRVTELLSNSNGNPSAAVIFIDINRFKDINDSFGHSVGDTVLRAVAQRLTTHIGKSDFAARLGSNEFAVALTDSPTPSSVSTFALQLRDALSSAYWAGSDEIACTVSIGAALAPSDGQDEPTLARHADLALNRAKAAGPGNVVLFKKDMDLAFARRHERERDLRNAVERNEFDLFFQPQVCLETNKISGQEALLRWRHPVHGTISPAYFIPLAEETGLILPIGQWVLRRACEEAVSWEAPIKVAVNLSPVQFKSSGISNVVREILDDTGLEPGRLEIEVTESMLMGDTEIVVSELNKLRDLGVAVAMDDFGTGYSSLSYISSFPFNKIKIDKAFVQAMTRDDALNAIVKCIIAMGHSLGVTITAEGVETSEQADLLRSYGCHQVQGFLYGRPANAKDCARQIAMSLTAEPSSAANTKRRSSAA